MKTTVVIDQEKLKRVMKLTGIKTRKQAIDFALDQAERFAQVMKAFEGDFFISNDKSIVDPKYKLESLRNSDRPKG